MWFRSTTSLANPSGLDGRLQRLAKDRWNQSAGSSGRGLLTESPRKRASCEQGASRTLPNPDKSLFTRYSLLIRIDFVCCDKACASIELILTLIFLNNLAYSTPPQSYV